MSDNPMNLLQSTVNSLRVNRDAISSTLDRMRQAKRVEIDPAKLTSHAAFMDELQNVGMANAAILINIANTASMPVSEAPKPTAAKSNEPETIDVEVIRDHDGRN
jgi:hypothetical protein